MTSASAASISGTLIVGAGQAGIELATQLRRNGYDKPVALIGEEPFGPYRRPPLSKAFLAGEATRESLQLRPESFYGDQQIDCVAGVRVEHIDRPARTARLSCGRTIAYETLVFATGGRPRRLPLPGTDLSNVHQLCTVADAARLQNDFQPGHRLLIVGGGYIGLETAAIGIRMRLHVTVVEARSRVLARAVSPVVSRFYERLHRERGVAIHTSTGVTALAGDGRVSVVTLSNGERLPVDLVLIAVGQDPNVELAQAAGLAVDNGIVVDSSSRTSDPAVYAIGDCSNHWNRFIGRRLRLESVAGAIEQARAAAASICGLAPPSAVAPWFWSDQYEVKLQTVGLVEGFDSYIVRGKTDSGRFTVFYLRNGAVIAADAVNSTQDFLVAKRIVTERLHIDAARLADETCALVALVPVAPRTVAA